MDIVYTFDDGYAAITTVSIISLLKSNKNVSCLNIYVVDYGISKENQKKIQNTIESFGRNVSFVQPINVAERFSIELDVKVWSLICYERLFYDELLPDCNKVLHIDCDTIVRENLQELYDTDINDVLAGACYDCTSRPKRQAGMPDYYQYISNGVLLLNLKKWREEKVSDRCIKYIEQKKGILPHLDQDVLTYVLQNQLMILPAKYNLMPITLMYKDLCTSLFKNDEPYYNKKQLADATKEPAIIHFTGNPIYSRPWNQPCFHPFNDEWISFYNESLYQVNVEIFNKRKRKYHLYKVLRSFFWITMCKSLLGRSIMFKIEKNKHFKKYL